jgi:hypothetical protein
MGDQSSTFSLTSPGLPEIRMSILPETPHVGKINQLPAPELAQKVITLNQQVIIKVYTRKRLKGKGQQVPEPNPMFGEL